MKQFFSKHSYNMVKMFLNQFATAIFGFSLSIAAIKAENTTLRNAASAFAILFYLFLLYIMTWEIGFRDKVSVETGRTKRNLFTGALISLCANIPNFLFAVFIMLWKVFPNGPFADLGAVGAFLASTFEGMYSGLLSIRIDGTPLNAFWPVYFILPLPAILICGVSYVMGLKDIKLVPGFNVGNPNEPKKKK